MKAVIIICLIAIPLISSCANKPALNANISAYKGIVTVNGTAISSTAHTVRFGDRIGTGDKSFCDILINDKSVIRLGQNTSFVFSVSDSDSSLILETGSLSALTRKLFTAGGKYTVQTPSVTAAVRGTSFFVNVEKEDSVYFCVCNGKIDLHASSNADTESITSSHHTGRRYVRNTDGSVTVDTGPGLKYHDDNTLETLAGIIGERIDWSVPDSD